MPEDPIIAVIALGDPLFGRDFELELEDRLRGHGVRVDDERSSMLVGDVLRRSGDKVSMAELSDLLHEAGFHMLVLVEVEYLGSRELQYLGRSSQAHQAQVHVNTYLTGADAGRALGDGWTEAVEYTELNAKRKAEMLLLNESDQMVGVIDDGWRSHRRDSGG